MKVIQKAGVDLRRGDLVCTWYGNQTLLSILPYKGPLPFICGIAHFAVVEMNIERDSVYPVLIDEKPVSSSGG